MPRVSGTCFPEPNTCHNCERFSKKPFDKSNLRRCTGCYYVTYCDEACQTEHW